MSISHEGVSCGYTLLDLWFFWKHVPQNSLVSDSSWRFLFPPPPEKGADPDDLDRWRGRKIEWFFTEGEEDLKLSDLPRPAILPPEFWDWFYGTGVGTCASPNMTN
eukprot:1881-Amphidinium_carterae.1